jgi:hypothetical protein
MLSRLTRSGLNPPWQQKIFPSIMAAAGKQLKQSMKVFHSFTLYRRLPRRLINFIVKMVWTCLKDGGGETAKNGTGMATIREKEARQTQTYLGGGDKRKDGRKGVTGRRLDR